MRINPIHIIRLLACAFIALLLAWVLCSCKTCECLPSVEYRDSIVTRYHHDTIQTYEKDSIFIHARGDTVWRERWSIRWRDKIVERHDTIVDTCHEVQVQRERYVPKYYSVVSWGFWIFIALLLLRIAWWVVKKYYGR